MFDKPDPFEHDAQVWREQARGFATAAEAAATISADTATAATEAVWKGPMPDDRLTRMENQAGDAADCADLMAEMASACHRIADEADEATTAIDDIRREWDDANPLERLGMGGDADDVRALFLERTATARADLADLAASLQPVIDAGDPLDFMFSPISGPPGAPYLGEQLDTDTAEEYFETGDLINPDHVNAIELRIKLATSGVPFVGPSDWAAWAEENGYTQAEIAAALDQLDADERAALNTWLENNKGDPNNGEPDPNPRSLDLTSFLWQNMRADQIEEFHNDVPALEPTLSPPADEWLQMMIDMNPELDLEGTGFEDIAQGSLGDCTTLASLAAIVAANPGWFEEHIKENGNGTYTVTLYDKNGDPVDVVVSGYIPGQNGNPELNGRDTQEATWATIFEKAMAQYQGGAYSDIDGFWPADLLPTITGKGNQTIPLDTNPPAADDLMNQIEEALEENRPITVVWRVPPNGGLHTLAVVGVDEDGNILVANPWANQDLLRLTPEEFLQEDYVHIVIND